MRWRFVGSLGVILALSPLACSDQSTPPPPAAGGGDQLADFAGSWDGYVELDVFDDGSDRVRLTLDAAGQGTMRFGERALFPPATNPDAPYPDRSPLSPGLLRAGYEYPVSRVRAGAGRLQLLVDGQDLYRGWCRMQQPVVVNANKNPDGPPSLVHACAHDWPVAGDDGNGICQQTDPVTNQTLMVACVKLQLCAIYDCFDPPGLGGGPCPPPPGALCACTASACDFAPLPADTPFTLDATMEDGGHKLAGSSSLPYRSMIRLMRL